MGYICYTRIPAYEIIEKSIRGTKKKCSILSCKAHTLIQKLNSFTVLHGQLRDTFRSIEAFHLQA